MSAFSFYLFSHKEKQIIWCQTATFGSWMKAPLGAFLLGNNGSHKRLKSDFIHITNTQLVSVFNLCNRTLWSQHEHTRLQLKGESSGFICMFNMWLKQEPTPTPTSTSTTSSSSSRSVWSMMFKASFMNVFLHSCYTFSDWRQQARSLGCFSLHHSACIHYNTMTLAAPLQAGSVSLGGDQHHLNSGRAACTLSMWGCQSTTTWSMTENIWIKQKRSNPVSKLAGSEFCLLIGCPSKAGGQSL